MASCGGSTSGTSGGTNDVPTLKPMTPARRWGSELRRVMIDNSVPILALAEAIGTSKSSVAQARSGRYLPSLQMASRYAEALMYPYLSTLCAELRTRTCEICEREFVEDHAGGHPQRWCDKECQNIGRSRIRRGKTAEETEKRYSVWKRRAKDRQRAIDVMCWTCEPEGACRQEECALRAHSPLPCVDVVDVSVAAKGTVRLERDDPRRQARLRLKKAEWNRQKRAKERAAA
jgi:transcriptional regulator with XRE-family HTH domain